LYLLYNIQFYRYFHISGYSRERRDFKVQSNEDNIMESNGLKKFRYQSNYVWAMNQKTADKKAAKKGWI